MKRDELIERMNVLRDFNDSTGWQQLRAIMEMREKAAFNAALLSKDAFATAKCLGEIAVLRDLMDWPQREAEALRLTPLEDVKPGPTQT